MELTGTNTPTTNTHTKHRKNPAHITRPLPGPQTTTPNHTTLFQTHVLKVSTILRLSQRQGNARSHPEPGS